MIRIQYLLCVSFLLISLGLDAQQVRFVAESNATDVVLGNAFRVSFRLENAKIHKINFPDFEKAGFKVMDGPLHSRQYTSINGKASRSETYSFILAPTKTGKLRIGSAQVRASGGRFLSSKSIEINCVKSSQGGGVGNQHNLPSSIAGKILFKVEASRQNAVVGEQVTLYFNIYTKIDISSIELTKEPEFENEYNFPIRYYDKSARIAVVNGQQYATKTIHAIGVFPSKEGTLEVEPAKMRIALGSGDPFNPFAGRMNYTLNSEPLSIKVESLMGKDPDFTGAVGEYEMQVYADKEEISTDDVVKVVMRIQGEGDLKRILPPKIKMSRQRPFDAYPPKIEEKITEGRTSLGGTKIFTYTFEPQQVGEVELRPNFTYYHTKKRKLVHQDTVLKITVTQGDRKVGRAAEQEAEALDSLEQAAERIEFKAALSSARWHKPAQPIFGSFLFWLITLSPVVLFWGIFGLRQLQKAQEKRKAEAWEHNKAERMLKEGMTLAYSYFQEQDSRNFFQTIGDSLKTYLGAKLDISNAELNKNKIIQQLEQQEFEESIIFRLENILKVCEESVFAGQNYHSTMQDTYQMSQELIKAFNKSWKQHA